MSVPTHTHITDRKLHKINKLFVKASIKSKPHIEVLALLDTGSESSVITKGLVDEMGLTDSLISSYNELQTFGDEVMVSKFSIELPLLFENQPTPIAVRAVVDNSKTQKLILGQNFLRHNYLNMDYGITSSQWVLRTSPNIKGLLPKISIPLHTNLKENSAVEKHRVLIARYSVPYIEAKINKKSVKAMIDTGAVTNIIEEQTIKKLGLTNDVKKSKIKRMRGANTQVKVTGQIALRLTFTATNENKTNITEIFQIVKESGEPLSIGLPFLIRNKLLIENGTGKLVNGNNDHIEICYDRDMNLETPSFENTDREKNMSLFYKPICRDI